MVRPEESMRFVQSLSTSALLTLAIAAVGCTSGDDNTDEPVGDGGGAGAGNTSPDDEAAHAAHCADLGLDVGEAEASGTVKLLVLGDTGEGNDAQREVAEAMDAKCEAVGGCTAVLMLGDNFYDVGVQGTDDEQWGPKFEEPYDLPNLNDLKFYATLGNHDYGPFSKGSEDAQVDYTYLEVGDGPGQRVSGKWEMPNTYYDVVFDHVHVFSMDTQDGSDEQKDAMSERVSCSKAAWKLVFGHHPRFTSGAHNSDSRGVLEEVLNMGMFAAQEAIYCGADMFLSGHDHNMEFIDQGRDPNCPNVAFAISGAGAKLRETREELLYPEDAGGEHQRFYQQDIEGFAYLELTGDSLSFDFIDKNGEVLFSQTLTK
jgi:tartrate-resistant acid phosphatase type 5